MQLLWYVIQVSGPEMILANIITVLGGAAQPSVSQQSKDFNFVNNAFLKQYEIPGLEETSIIYQTDCKDLVLGFFHTFTQVLLDFI